MQKSLGGQIRFLERCILLADDFGSRRILAFRSLVGSCR